jgi:ferredoxin
VSQISVAYGRYLWTATWGADDGRASLRVHVDPDKCQGHNRCYALAPELFDVDDLGFASELNAGVVPEKLEDQARAAVANCPEFAISITEQP